MPIRRAVFWAWLVGVLLLGAVGGARADSAALREQVFAEYPRLNPQHPEHATLSDWEAVCMLREFSYRHTNYANSVRGESYRWGTAAVKRLRKGEGSLAEVYAFFDQDGGGVVCGDTALVLDRLYRAFGFDAWSVGFGFGPPTRRGSRFTHVQTLVRIVDKSDAEPRSVLTLQDPSTNVGYVDAGSGRPLDYLDLLHRLVRREADTVAAGGAVTDGVTRSDPVTIAFADETAGREPDYFTRCWNVGFDYMWEDLGGGKWKFIAPRTPQMFDRLGDRWWNKELVTEGLPPNYLYLHLFFQGVHSTTEDRAVGAAARAIVRHDPAAAEWYRAQEKPAEPLVAAAEAPESVTAAQVAAAADPAARVEVAKPAEPVASVEPAVPTEPHVPTFIEWIRVRLVLFIGMAAASVALLVVMGLNGRWSVWGVVPPLVATGLAAGYAASTAALPRPEVLAVLLVVGPALGWMMHQRAGRNASA